MLRNLLVVTVGLLLVGCQAGALPGAAPQRPAAEVERRPVKLALSSTVLTVGYPFLTTPQALNYWTMEGLDVEIVLTQGTEQVLQLLASGRADLGLGNPEPVIIARQRQNLAVRSVAAIGTIGSWSIGVPVGSAIQSVRDLRGRNIGVFSMASGGIPYLKARLKDDGIDPEREVDLLPVGFGATAGEALQSGKVDALVLWSTAFAGLKNAGFTLAFLPPAAWEGELYSFNVLATDQAIRDQPEVIQRVLRGIAKGSDFTFARPEAAVQVFWNQHPETIDAKVARDVAFRHDLEVVKAELRDMGFGMAGLPSPPARVWGEQKAGRWQALQEYLVNTGQVSQQLDPTLYFTDQFTAAANAYDHAAIIQQAREYRVEVPTE
jgi:NitT/TauT family transport system substrate-binding protein